jgi:zinc protease
LLGDLLIAALWGDTPFARPPDADAASLDALTADQVAAFHAAHYDPTRVVLAVAGACEAAEVGSALASLPVSPAPAAGGALPRPAFEGAGAYHYAIPIDVTHLAVAVPVPGMGHPDRAALRLLDYILGRGGSSRLYRELRESRGLAYNCSSIFMPYAHVGVFAAQARCAPERGSEVAALLRGALLALAARAPSADELSAAQQRYAGALYRSFETNATLVSILSLETVLDEWEPFDQAVARVAAVTPADLAAVTARCFDPARLVQVSVGPLDPRASEVAPAPVP